MQIKNVFRRELYGYFNSPVAYIFLVIFITMTGYFTFGFGGFYEARQADLRSFFHFHPLIYLVFVPAIAMRLWSEERMSGTIQLLLTLPITVAQAVIGKFLAAWAFLGVALLLTSPMIFTVWYLGSPDNGVIFTSYLGSFLMAGSYLAVGAFTSSLTKNQVVSFVLSIALCFVILLPSLPMVVDFLRVVLPNGAVEFVASLGFWVHFESIKRGVIDIGDVVYFVSLIVFMLYANVLVIEAKKSA